MTSRESPRHLHVVVKPIGRIANTVKSMTPPIVKRAVKRTYQWPLNLLSRLLINPFSRLRYAGKPDRKLEIGPGPHRLEGFETVNVVGGWNVDYVYDAAKRLPFQDNTFSVVYASHVLEHIPWFRTEQVLREWARILMPGGRLEIWVPDGELICETILDHSRGQPNDNHLDGWRKRNPNSDPFLWANGRLFYGATEDYPSWHKAVFTEVSLKGLFSQVGLVDLRLPSPSEYRSGAHREEAINLGMFGTKSHEQVKTKGTQV